MHRSFSRISIGVLSCLALAAPACDDGAAVNDEADLVDAEDDAQAIDPPAIDPVTYLSGIDGDFVAAAEEFRVPAQLLQAIGYAETQWQMVEGEEEFEGYAPAFGVMALRGEALARAAGLIGADVERVKKDRRTNLRAAAALLSAYADELGLDRGDLGAWAPAVARYSGIPDSVPEAQADYVHNSVYAALQAGVDVTDLDGGVVASLEPVDVVPDFTDALNPSAAPGPDYAASIWRPSPTSNYGARPAGTNGQIGMIIIHSCEGAYSGCWGWLVNSQSGVSAHYVVKEDGSEISQLVRESNRAYHIAASYQCNLNSNVECWRNGNSGNNFTVGIEHAGFAAQASWNSNLINNSAKLSCDIAKAYNIPRDKYHIVAHGQLQPATRVDPGKNWPWSTYITKINEACGAQQPPPPSGSEIIVDSNNSNNDATKAKIVVSANWVSTSSSPGFYGSGYFYANTAPVSDAAEFQFYLPAAATKTIDAWWVAGTNRAAAAPFVAFNAQGTKLGTVNVNQTANGGKWNQLGTFNFTAGWNKIVVSRWTTEGKVVIADAVRIR